MNEIISIDNFSQINNVLDLVHDCWFDIEKIQFSEQDSILKLFFEEKKLFKFGKKKTGVLKVKNVISYKIKESEYVGIYDINRIGFDEKNKTLFIITGIPLNFFIKVSSFNISVHSS